jgi:hypothetical protein
MQPVPSKLHADAWEYYLRDYPDSTFVSTLLHIIRFGANIGCIGPQHDQSCKNLRSAAEHPGFVASTLQTMVENGQLAGPFPTPPLPNFRASPLGVVSRKRNPGKLRIINHLSWPSGTSVNDGISDSESRIEYDRFDRAVEDLIRSGPGSRMAKLDLKDAFRHIPVRVQDYNLLGLHWGRKFYYLLALTFGLRNAPYIFNLFAEALHWIIQHHIPAHIRHYLDDFLLNFGPSTPLMDCYAAIEWVMALGEQLGLTFQLSKTVWPTCVIEFLGLILDSLRMEARLPDDKLSYLRELLCHWEAKTRASLHKVQELSGFLQFCCQVIPNSRPFLRRIFDFQSKFRSPFCRLRVPTGVRSDIAWWAIFSKQWNGVRLLRPSLPLMDVYSDASGWKGIGAVLDHRWFASRIPRRYRNRDIQFKELYAILRVILHWGDEWSAHHVVFHCDNQDVVAWLSSGTCRSKHAMPLVRLIFMLAACLHFSFSSLWLPSSSNALADAASRFQYSRLLQLAPHLNHKPCYPKSHLIGMKHTLTTLLRSRSSSGMVSQPVLGRLTALGRSPSLTSQGSIRSCLNPRANSFQPQSAC